MKSLKTGIIYPHPLVVVVVIILLLGCSDKSTTPGGEPGDWIAYLQISDDGTDICRMDPDGSNPINLTGGEGYNDFPDWSSTRERLVYASDRNGQYDIYVMNSDGGSVTRMTTDPGNDLGPKWVPDDNRIAFLSDRDGGIMELYVISRHNHDAIRLTDGNTSVGYNLAWSPDGHTLAFICLYTEYGEFGDLCLVDDDGANERIIADSANTEYRIQWSSDGVWILFTGYENRYLQVYVVNFDGSSLTNLTSQLGSGYDGQWSPDESRIAFTRFLLEDQDVFVMNSAGSEVVNLTNEPGDDRNPIWSPDGSKILFETYLSGELGETNLYIMDDDGGNEMLLTDTVVSSYGPRRACW